MRYQMIRRENRGLAICDARADGFLRRIRVSFNRPRTVRFGRNPVHSDSVSMITVHSPLNGPDSVRVHVVRTRSPVAAV